MINVTTQTKNAYKKSSEKTLTISFPSLSLTYTNENIIQESLTIDEMLESNEYLQFTGCNASKATFSLFGISAELKGQAVTISIKAGNTETIPLFHGFVDSQSTKDYTTGTCEFVCYDVLYTLSSVDVAEWYITLFESTDVITIKDFRDILFSQLGITVESVVLPNDNLTIKKEYSPNQLCALDLIKNICQINGVFGIINRNGNFEFRSLGIIGFNTAVDTIPYYKALDYQRFTAQGVQKVLVRQTEEDVGGYGGTPVGNTFIIQGNFFTMGLNGTQKAIIGMRVYTHIANRSYIPFSADISGFPWLEVGDIVTYNVYDYVNNTTTPMDFYVMSRSLNGIQALMDTQSADGDKDRSIFVSDTHTQIDTIKSQIEEIVGKLNSLSLQYTMFYNESDVNITDGQTVAVCDTAFSISLPSQVHIEMEYMLECTTKETSNSEYVFDNDLVVTAKYELDGTIIDTRQPKETYQDGDHILHTYYVVNIPDTVIHTWRVFLKCEGGSVHIDQYKAQNTILGLGTVTGDVWDGSIKVNEAVPAISFNGLISTFTDSASVETQLPPTFEPTDSVSAISFAGLFSAFTDSVSLDSSYLDFYPYDGVTATTCSIENYKWKGAGTVTLPELTLTNNASMVADADSGISFLISDDNGTTWYGYNGTSWVEDYDMSLTQFNDLTEYKGLSVIVKATLLADNYLTNIKVYGGAI